MPKALMQDAVEPPSLHWSMEEVQLLKSKDGQQLLLIFAHLLVDLYEVIALGNDAYITFGLSRRNKTALLTYTIGGQKLYASGGSLEELAEGVKDLL